MEEFRVPTTPIEAELQLVDGRVLRGAVFVPASAPNHPGSERLEEWLNEPALFFPFRPEGEKGADLIGKNSVLRLSVAANAALDERTTAPAERCPVALECDGGRFEGEMLLDMPDHQRRVLDYANQASAFVSLHHGDRVHMIQKRKIIRIVHS